MTNLKFRAVEITIMEYEIPNDAKTLEDYELSEVNAEQMAKIDEKAMTWDIMSYVGYSPNKLIHHSITVKPVSDD